MFEVFITGAATGALAVMIMILVIQKIEQYRDRQDFLQSRAALYDKARREGRI
jgi:uncharacterized membrane protein required for colicin V production